MKKNKSPGITPVSMKKKNQSPGITPVSMKKKNQSPGITPVSMKKKNLSPGITPVLMKKKNQSPGITPVSMKKKNQSPGKTPVSLKKKNKTPGKSPESLIKVQKKGMHAKKLIESTLKVNQAVATQTPSQKKQKPATHTPQSAGGDTVTPQNLSKGQMNKLKKGGGCSPVVTKKSAKRKLGDGEGEGAPAAKKGAKKLKAKAGSAEGLKLTADKKSKKMRRKENKLKLRTEQNLSSNKFALIFKNNRISLKGAANTHVMKVLEKAEDIIVERKLEVVCQDKEMFKMLKAELKAVPQCREFTVEPVYEIDQMKTQKMLNKCVYAAGLVGGKISDLKESIPKGIKYNIFKMRVMGEVIRVGRVKYDTEEETQEALAKKVVQVCGKQVLLVNGKSAIKRAILQKMANKNEKAERSAADKKARKEKEEKKRMRGRKAMKEMKEKRAADKAANAMVKTAVENGTAEEEEKAAVEEDKMEVTTKETEDKEKGDKVSDDDELEEGEEEEDADYELEEEEDDDDDDEELEEEEEEDEDDV